MTEAKRNGSDNVTFRDLDERTCRLMAIITSAKEADTLRHDAITAQVGAAEKVLGERLHLLNELRGDVITKTEYLAQHNALASEFHGVVKLFQSEISGLKEWKAEQGGKASQTAVIGAYVIAVAGWLIGPLIALAIERVMQ